MQNKDDEWMTLVYFMIFLVIIWGTLLIWSTYERNKCELSCNKEGYEYLRGFHKNILDKENCWCKTAEGKVVQVLEAEEK